MIPWRESRVTVRRCPHKNCRAFTNPVTDTNMLGRGARRRGVTGQLTTGRAGRRRLVAVALATAAITAAVFVATLEPAFAAGPRPIPVTPFSGYNPTLLRAPYVTDLTQTSADVNWATSVSNVTSPGSLQWGPLGSCTAHTTAVPANLPNSYPTAGTPTSITGSAYTVVAGSNEYQSTVVISGLSPSTKYCYRPLGPGSVDLLGSNPTQSFTTLNPAGTATPLTFDVVGDLGETLYSSGTAFPNNLNTDQAAIDSLIGQSASTAGAKFVVTAGDVAYSGGTQADYGDLSNTGSEISDIFGPSYWPQTGGLPVYAGEGNHGQNTIGLHNWPEGNIAQSSNGVYAYDSYPALPADGTSAASYPDAWYAVSDGGTRIYVIDAAWADGNVGTTNMYQVDRDAHWTTSSPEYQWLSADLASHPNAIKMAVFHYPVRSDNSTQGSDTNLENTGSNPNSLEALLAANGVQLAFNGHAHTYQRITPTNYQQNGQIVNYVTGGGGAILEPVSGGSACSGFASTGSVYAIGWSPTSNTGSACGTGVPTPQSAAQVFNYLQVSVNGNQVTVTPVNAAGQVFDQQTYTYSGVTTKPVTVIDSSPPALTNATSASVTFHATGGVSSFACRLDSGSTSACSSPLTYSGLTSGSHTVTVTGSGATPVTATWTVDTVPPSVPSGLSATAISSTQINLAWTGSSDNSGITGYDIYRGGTLLTTTSGTGTTYSDTSVTASKLYSYTIDARDGAGNVSGQSSPPATVSTPGAPSGPALVQAAGSSTTTVTLPAASTPGDLLVLSASAFTGASKPISAVSDGRNSWTKVLTKYVSGQNSDGELWYAPNAASVQGVTVTTGATTVALQLQEFSGVATSKPFLDASAGSAATSSSASSSPVTPATTGELAVGFIAGHGSTQAAALTSPGFTNEPLVTTSSPSKVSVISGYQALSSTTAQSYAGTFATAMYWAAGIALFKSGNAPPPPGDFSISTSPTAGTAVIGSPATASVHTATLSGSPQTVGLTASGLPTGATAQFAPATITSDGSSVISIATSSATPAGIYPITVTGTGTGTSHQAIFAMTVNTPAAISSANTTTFTEGTAGAFMVTTTGSPSPSLSIGSSPLPVGVTFSDNSDGTATLAGTPAAGSNGSYPLVIGASGAGPPATQSFTLVVNALPSDFSVGVPASAQAVAGSLTDITVTTSDTLGPSQTIALSVDGLPTGASSSFTPGSVSSGASSDLRITPAPGTMPGTYTISVTGAGTTHSHTVTFALVVNTPPTITSPNTVTFTVGIPGTFTVSATGSSPIGLSIGTSTLPGGVTFTDNGDGTATLAGIPAAFSASSYPLTITASNGYGAPASQSFTLSINAAPPQPDFAIAASPPSATVLAGSTAVTSITTTAVNGPQSVALSASGLPAGALLSFTPPSVTSGGNSSMRVITSPSTTGTFDITVTGTGDGSGTPSHSTTFSLTVSSVAAVPHLVQTASGTETASATSLSGSFPLSTGGGDLLVLTASEYSGASNHITSVTDTAGNTWKLVGSYNTPGHNSDGEMWYAVNTSPTVTVTVHNSAKAFVSFEVQDFAGLSATASLNGSTGASDTSTAANSGTVNSTVAGGLAVGFVAGHSNAEAIMVNSPGYTNQGQQTTTGSNATVIAGYQLLGAPGPQSFAGSFAAAMYWAAGIAIFGP
jgi:hypothetical protein